MTPPRDTRAGGVPLCTATVVLANFATVVHSQASLSSTICPTGRRPAAAFISGYPTNTTHDGYVHPRRVRDNRTSRCTSYLVQ